MMSKKYAKGRRLEYRVKKYLEGCGWCVFRCAGSKPVDLLALKEGQACIVECKTSRISKKELQEKLSMAKSVKFGLMVVIPGQGWSYVPPEYEPFEFEWS
jgi:Holliday junction resolvase